MPRAARTASGAAGGGRGGASGGGGAGVDAATRKWIRGPADELAIAEGCRFDVERAEFVVTWIQSYCRLYEGERAGEPLMLLDWQLEATMRLFGWVRYSQKWGRFIRRFRQASIWTAKKNAKTPTEAAWGLYLLCGDGEPGQKVYLAAKDGTQARELAGKHVMEMLAQSPELSAECSINKGLMQVTHEPSRSIMRPLSSSNDKTQRSKEGLNGSILVDEVHVVDREFMSIVSRAGISRSEPLQIEVSTAGDNPDGYGKERFDYACDVDAGRVNDSSLFAMIHAAPQDLADADLDADPIKYGKMANPAWGRLIDPVEFLEDYRRSKASLPKLLSFKMYRLNIWQSSANPWLKQSDWANCKPPGGFTEEDLEGRTCYAGLDLSRTRDMSCLALVFPEDDGGYTVLVYFWMPKEYAKANDHLASFSAWAAAGYLTLTPGNVVDYGYIKAAIRKLAGKFNIAELAYDQHYAEEMTQSLEQGEQDDAGKVIDEGLGITRVAFPQTLMTFTGPSKEFERLVIGGKLRHNGHPVLAWQAGHVRVKTDFNANIRPVKPKGNDIRKIDGIVATVMGLSRALVGTAGNSAIGDWDGQVKQI